MELWLNTPEDITTRLERIRAHILLTGKETIPNVALMGDLAAFMRGAITQRKPVMYEPYFLEMGRIVLSLLGPRFDETAFVTLLLEKHKRYGVEALMGWGELGICIRIDSKVDRVKNMTKAGVKTSGDESVVDSLVDIVGYCILGLVMQERRAATRAASAQPKILTPHELTPAMRKLLGLN